MGQNKNAMTLRQTAKDCIKDGRQTEAFLHLSHALKLDEGNVEILSERSKCCIENLQYHFALEDAKKILELSPDSWLGHVRLAEIYLSTSNHEEALGCYQTGFQCMDSDKVHCKTQMDRCKREMAIDSRTHMQLPWVGSALGIIVSSMFLVLDYLAHGSESYLAHPILKVGVCGAAATAGYWSAKLYREYTLRLRKQMLEPPLDLLADFSLLDKPHKD
eukprot:TRINITY_DN2924_c0_g1_i1.p1 TRINITY_DN2924_c0_g1~~TRINITY_DN2924_c0_g1_i1.p1  ORF type:complete len:218 (-),score=66.65 TRINITY_DN2924_c0_g1_i1:523-1176(-)